MVNDSKLEEAILKWDARRLNGLIRN